MGVARAGQADALGEYVVTNQLRSVRLPAVTMIALGRKRTVRMTAREPGGHRNRTNR